MTLNLAIKSSTVSASVAKPGISSLSILAATRAEGPSVIQIRGQDLSPKTLGPILVDVLRDHERAVSVGAIVTVDVRNARVRRLPLR